jgi:hypothetical protein
VNDHVTHPYRTTDTAVNTCEFHVRLWNRKKMRPSI